ncbi:hypothetical protein JOD54_001924 [Actinokineospora baliensis]|uniref:hypothetical protein n=1 Tax=Actinokineospora baliensis TaxID=547056 RepID=UPI00195C34FC|nr:hypothetical protein [Actinokineospora baliensis]MBM7771720.1 hypothetical protein [Actinokineospora baliensis]
MQAPDDQDLADAVTAPDRVPLARLQVDWNRDGGYTHPLSELSTVVKTITVERSITGDLPPETTLVEGYTTAKLTCELGGTRPGDPRDIARMLSPFRADRSVDTDDTMDAPTRLDLGLLTIGGPRWVRQFTGATRAARLSASRRTATIESLDPAERLRASVTLPLWAMGEAEWRNPRRYPYRNLTNTSWVIDHVLRRNGIYSSPPPREGAIWGMTCHGSLAPDIGWNAGVFNPTKTSAAVPEFVEGRYGLAANGSPDVFATAFAAPTQRPYLTAYRQLIEFEIRAGATNQFHSQSNGTVLAISDGYIKLEGNTIEVAVTTAGQLVARLWANRNSTVPTLVGTVTGPSITGPARWHSAGLSIVWFSDGTVYHRWHLDGVQTADTATVIGRPVDYPILAAGQVNASTPLPVQCLRLSQSNFQPLPDGWGLPHTPGAQIDTGLNWFPGLPDVVNGDSWQLITTAARAEYGTVAFDEHGRFTFRSRARPRTAPVKNITADLDLTDLEPVITLDSVRNEITYRTTARFERDTDEVVFQADTLDQFDSPPGTTSYDLQLAHRSVVYPTMRSYTADTWPAPFSGFVAVNATTGARVSNVEVTLFINTDQLTLGLLVKNPNTFTIRMAAGTRPALQITGSVITEDTTYTGITRNSASAARYGRRVLDLPDNDFRQRPESTHDVATSLLDDLATPVAILPDVPVVGDPRVQLTDVVTIHDPDGLGGPISAAVIGSRRTHNTTDGLADSLTLRVLR